MTLTANAIDPAGTSLRERFGTLADGSAVERITLANRNGLRAQVLTRGAALHAMSVPDRAGIFADIVLDHPDLEGMLAKPQYFGATVGRVANRIAGCAFTLDGRRYALPDNDHGNSLHGGAVGFDQANWEITASDGQRVALRHVSPDGDQGYPGTLTATATYALDDDDRLTIEYRAVTDRPTLVNLTHHACWNLAGEGSGSAMDHELMIAADRYTPIDGSRIPTGEIRAVAGSAFDFLVAKPISRDLRDDREPQLVHGAGYDHNWVVGMQPSPEPRLVASVLDRKSGRMLSLSSTQPGVQFYSTNFFDGSTIGKSGRRYRRGDGFALEPQGFPDAPNHHGFPSLRLEPGEEYLSRIVYRFSVHEGSIADGP